MMDMVLDGTVELISFTLGKQFKCVFINPYNSHALHQYWSKTDVGHNLHGRIFFANVIMYVWDFELLIYFLGKLVNTGHLKLASQIMRQKQVTGLIKHTVRNAEKFMC